MPLSLMRSIGVVANAAARTGNLAWALEEMADSSVRRSAYRLRAFLGVAFPLVVMIYGGGVFADGDLTWRYLRHMAGRMGLDGAIMNPLDKKMMANICTAEAIAGKDNYCMNYLKSFRAGMIEG